jgi:type I restriction enzyme R subunit
LVLRPYQIAASEKILNKIVMATNSKQVGSIDAGGYVWHTTGSGKTLTSFKTAQLATNLPYIDKVLFVVDRKDLDYQTMKEYDKFEKGAANSTTNTKELEKQLRKTNSKIIITTIQKLSHFIDTNRGADIFNKHIVLIFDECHRSQFGDMHTKIVKAFKNYHLFGFTGTPIFAENSNLQLKTTEQTFGTQLHSYTIINAINDENVLPFRIDYVNTIKMKEGVKDKKVLAIDIKNAENSPKRISKIVSYILEHFDQKTKRNDYYNIESRRLAGFNSIFAVSSIEMAKKYYTEFKEQQKDLKEKLKVALIYSFSANEDFKEDGILAEEDFDTGSLDEGSRVFLDNAIKDYNSDFAMNFNISSGEFQNYYKDLSKRVKNREVDLLIVVNMFLTGFDATTLNTLWVDKNLRYHGLLQGFSRTNRILNSVKTFGNIVCFRDLEEATNDAISMFANKEASGIVLLKTYDDYYNGYEKDDKHQNGYRELIDELRERFSLPIQLDGEQVEKSFIKLYGAILKIKNILSTFDEFTGNEILTEREFQDYQSAYLDLYDKLRKTKNRDKENINDDIVFEMELVKQITISIDYILLLVEKYKKTKMKDKEILVTIDKAINSSVELRSKKELIEGFINTLNSNSNIDEDWKKFTTQSKAEELKRIIEEEGLKPEATQKFIDNIFRDGEIRSNGTEFAGILPAVSMFNKDNKYTEKKFAVLERLKKFFEKYWGA